MSSYSQPASIGPHGTTTSSIYSKIKSVVKSRRSRTWDESSSSTSSTSQSETSTLFEFSLSALKPLENDEDDAPDYVSDYRLDEGNCAWTTPDRRGVSGLVRSFPTLGKKADAHTGADAACEHPPSKGLFSRQQKAYSSGVVAELLDPEDRAWM